MPVYPSGRRGILDESIKMKSGEVRVALVAKGYRYAKAHETVKDLGDHVMATSEPLAGKEFTDDGGFRADAVDLAAEHDGEAVSVVVIQGKRLVAHLDDVDGLPADAVKGQEVRLAWAGDIFVFGGE